MRGERTRQAGGGAQERLDRRGGIPGRAPWSTLRHLGRPADGLRGAGLARRGEELLRAVSKRRRTAHRPKPQAHPGAVSGAHAGRCAQAGTGAARPRSRWPRPVARTRPCARLAKRGRGGGGVARDEARRGRFAAAVPAKRRGVVQGLARAPARRGDTRGRRPALRRDDRAPWPGEGEPRTVRARGGVSALRGRQPDASKPGGEMEARGRAGAPPGAPTY